MRDRDFLPVVEGVKRRAKGPGALEQRPFGFRSAVMRCARVIERASTTCRVW
jgi:hypothetical protein